MKIIVLSYYKANFYSGSGCVYLFLDRFIPAGVQLCFEIGHNFASKFAILYFSPEVLCLIKLIVVQILLVDLSVVQLDKLM